MAVAQSQTPPTGGVRFAPSPTGRFHIGNLRTAWISHLIARELKLPWIVRFEDIDKPRVVAGSMESQLADLKVLGLIPDRVLIQSSFVERHWDVFLTAIENNQVYACDCSRKDVQSALSGLASAPHGETPAYSGHCRTLGRRELKSTDSIAWRFRMPTEAGTQDFIIARSGSVIDHRGFPSQAEFTPSYHWACAIDDYDGRYDWIVRASDLKPALSLQRAIQTWISDLEGHVESLPVSFHTSLVTQDNGDRLEKRTKGVTLKELQADGLFASSLIGIFEKSFSIGAVTDDGSETQPTLKLSRLLGLNADL